MKSLHETSKTGLALSFVVVTLCSCGGGGGGSSTAPPPTAPPPTAMALFVNTSTTNLLPTAQGGPCMDVDQGDIDGDGDTDLVLAIEFGTNLVLTNSGAGVFTITAGAVNGGNGDNEDVRLRDFNGNGSLDMLSVHEDDGVHALLYNNGAGVFTDMSSLIPVTSIANATEVLDLNGDGRLDILLGNSGQNRVLLQQLDGSFIDDTANRPLGFGITQDILVIDVDGDSDPDIFVANEAGNQLLINDGNGFFTDETNSRLPLMNNESREADSADIDNDGDLDIIVANVNFNSTFPIQNQLLINDGAGNFTDATATRLAGVNNVGSSFTIKFVDIDNDGDPDILSPVNNLNSGGQVDVWMNNGAGTFATASVAVFSEAPRGSAFDIEVIDADGDGNEDIYFCYRTGQDQLFLRQ